VPSVGSLNARELDALVERATVDAYDADEQLAGFHFAASQRGAVDRRLPALGLAGRR